MFSKSRINEPGAKPSDENDTGRVPSQPATKPSFSDTSSSAAAKPKPAPSVLSSDLMVKGNLRTTGDIQVEGTVEGDIRAHLLTIGESATIKGEIVADDVVVNGRITGRVRGLKVRLTSTARVEGDIIHKTIAIESGAHFEGSVQRQEDPLGTSSPARAAGGAPAQASPQPASKPAAAPVPAAKTPAAENNGKD